MEFFSERTRTWFEQAFDAPTPAQVLGWPADAIVDLGDISGARGTEMYLPLWLRLFMTQGSPHVSIRIVKG